MEPFRVLLVGLGSLGSQVLDLLLRLEAPLDVLVASRNVAGVHSRTNLAVLAALQLGYTPSVTSVSLDLNDLDRTAELIDHFDPQLIFGSACLQSWWVPQSLPKELSERLDQAHVGPWLPMHLTLLYKLMQAIKLSGRSPMVVNSSYPDVTHPVLEKIGLAPHIGIGNVSNPIPAIRMAISSTLGIAVRRISVNLVAHHYVSHRLSRYGNAGGAPFRLTTCVDGEDVTKNIDVGMILSLLPTRFKRPGGVHGQLITATSAINVLRAIILDENRVIHAPGPNGLPGGYAVRVGRGSFRVVLPAELSLEEAIGINESGMQYDGIQHIEQNGTVLFTEREMAIMNEMLGYHRHAMHPDESEACALELLARYRQFSSALRPLAAA